jgi:hypothetical protein
VTNKERGRDRERERERERERDRKIAKIRRNEIEGEWRKQGIRKKSDPARRSAMNWKKRERVKFLHQGRTRKKRR